MIKAHFGKQQHRKDTLWSWKKISCWDRKQHPSYLPGQATYLLRMTEKKHYHSCITCQMSGTSMHVHSKYAETSTHESLECWAAVHAAELGGTPHSSIQLLCLPGQVWMGVLCQRATWLLGCSERCHWGASCPPTSKTCPACNSFWSCSTECTEGSQTELTSQGCKHFTNHGLSFPIAPKNSKLTPIFPAKAISYQENVLFLLKRACLVFGILSRINIT